MPWSSSSWPPRLPLPCRCAAEVITHCDTLRGFTSYYEAFNVVPCWPYGLAKTAADRRARLGPDASSRAVKVLPSADPSQHFTTFKRLLSNFVWHSAWLLIDHLLWSTLRKCKLCKTLSYFTSWDVRRRTTPAGLLYTHSVVFSLHFKLQSWKDGSNKEETANQEDFPCVFPWVFSPFLDLLHFSLWDYIRTTVALPDGKTLSLSCHALFGHEGERFNTCSQWWLLGKWRRNLQKHTHTHTHTHTHSHTHTCTHTSSCV